jgi:hypothetical protein
MIALVLAFAAALLAEVPGLLGRRDRRELLAFLVFMAAAFAFCALIVTGVLKPGFSAMIDRLAEPVLRALGILPLLAPD